MIEVALGAALFGLAIYTIWSHRRNTVNVQLLSDNARLLADNAQLLEEYRQLFNASQLEVRRMIGERGEEEKKIRADAAKRSRSSIKGKVGETWAPFLHDFPYNSEDCHFLGQPVDYLIFDWGPEKELKQIVLLEIKTGTATLSTRQRRVRDAIKDGKVIWDEYRIDG